MTSKNLCFNPRLLFATMRRKIWLLILVTIGFFFSLPVALTISLQGAHRNIYNNVAEESFAVISVLKKFFFAGSFNGLLLALLGVAAALVFFSYLHNRRTLDFFHSQPISFSTLFVQNYTAGALSIILPYTVMYLISLGIVGVFGDFSALAASSVVYGWVVPIIQFLIVYSLGVLGAVVTGNSVIQGCVTFFFLLVIPVCILEYAALLGNFFRTYIGDLPYAVLYWTSPLFHGFFWDGADFYPLAEIFIGLFTAFVIFALSLFLYRRRKSESAGTAFAFTSLIPFVKYPLVVLGSIGFSLLFHAIGNDENTLGFWFIFGGIVGAILVSRGLEVIIAFDFRGIKRHWGSLGISLLAVIVIVGCFALDVSGYDTYLPDAKDVKTVGFELGEFNIFGEAQEYSTEQYGADRAFAAKLHGAEEKEAVIQIAEVGISMLPKLGQNGALLNTEEAANVPSTYCKVAYRLKSGRLVERYYSYIPKAKIEKAVETLILSSEYKRKQLSFLDESTTYLSNVQYVNTGYYLGAMELNKVDMAALADAYQKDAENITLNDAEKTIPVVMLTFLCGSEDSGFSKTLPVYESYENVLSLFQDLGYSYKEYGLLTVGMITSIKEQSYDSLGNVAETQLPPERYEEVFVASIASNSNSFFTVASGEENLIVQAKTPRGNVEVLRNYGSYLDLTE